MFAGGYVYANADRFGLALKSADPAVFLLALPLCVLYWFGLAVCWWLLQRLLGGGLEFWPAVRAWSVSTVARYVPGNVWHLAGRSVLAARSGGDPLAAAASSIYEQLFTVAGALLLAGVFMPLMGGGIYGLAALAVPATLALLHPAVQRLLLKLAARFTRRPLPRVLPWNQLALVLVAYSVAQVPAGLALSLLAIPGDLPLPAGVGGFAFAWAVGYLSFLTPSGVGVREVALAAILTPFGKVPDLGLLAIAHRVVMTAAEFALAGAFALSGRFHAQKSPDQPAAGPG